MAYNKQGWVPYDPNLSFEQNTANGGVSTSDRLNNMETGIGNSFDKTSDTVGIRNYLLNSAVPITISDGGANNRFVTIPTNLSSLQGNYVFNADVSGLVGGQTSLTIGLCNPLNTSDNIPSDVPIVNGKVTKKFNVTTTDNTHTDLLIYSGAGAGVGSAGCTAIYSNYGFYKTDAAITDWVPAPEDVNQQLDKKVTDNKDNTITVNGTDYNLSNSSLKDLTFVSSGSFNDLPMGTVLANAVVMTDGPDTTYGYTTTTFSSTQCAGRKAQIAIADAVNLMYFRISESNFWNPWTLLADNSTVVHTTDMRKPASDVVGLEDVPQAVIKAALDSGVDLHTVTTPGIYPFNGCTFVNDMNSDTKWGFLIVTNVGNQVVLQQMIQGDGQAYGQHIYNGGSNSWSDWSTPADDSKVAHLSGANNFDTVPTVNNKSVATTDDVTTASNTVLTSANNSISKLLQSSSNNDEDSAVTSSTSDTSNFYYWTE